MSFEVKEGIVWDWLYCIAPELQWFISWGIAGKLPLSRSYDIEFESPLQVIVLLGSDRQDIPYSHEEIQDWRNRGSTRQSKTPTREGDFAGRTLRIEQRLQRLL
jgi:hypothetical protein